MLSRCEEPDAMQVRCPPKSGRRSLPQLRKSPDDELVKALLRSDDEIAAEVPERAFRRLEGVVDVTSKLQYRFDDDGLGRARDWNEGA